MILVLITLCAFCLPFGVFGYFLGLGSGNRKAAKEIERVRDIYHDYYFKQGKYDL